MALNVHKRGYPVIPNTIDSWCYISETLNQMRWSQKVSQVRVRHQNYTRNINTCNNLFFLFLACLNGLTSVVGSVSALLLARKRSCVACILIGLSVIWMFTTGTPIWCTQGSMKVLMGGVPGT